MLHNILFFDIETDGLLKDLNTVHCLSIRTETDEVLYPRDKVEEGVKRLMDHMEAGQMVCGHNVIAFDLPAIAKVYPWFKAKQDKVLDTLVLARLLCADIGNDDDVRIKRNGFPKQLRGSLSLEAWGHRLNEYKGEFKGPWTSQEVYDQAYALQAEAWGCGDTDDTTTLDCLQETAEEAVQSWLEEMYKYCSQDTVVTMKLFQHLHAMQPTARSVELEHKVQFIVQRQVRHGVSFDTDGARALLAKLTARREELVVELKELFGPMYVPGEVFTPKANNARLGYTGGCSFTKLELQEFNPGSRDQIAERLRRNHGWEPRDDQLTPTGKPKIDEDVLKDLNYPCIPLLLEYLTVVKRISQVSDGASGWLKHVTEAGRIHGGVNTGGTVTGRMTHSSPNLAQVPKVGSLYGEECRALFRASPGYKLVGVDADGLELRCLSHFLFPYDRGQYAKAVDEGKKENGTDIHTLNQQAAGLPTRDNAKTFIYGWLYGAGDAKIGKIIGKGSSAGKRLKDSFLRKLPALGQLKEAVVNALLTNGFLKGLDGRKLHSRSEHSALNLLLQSAGALLMKQALIILDERLQEMGLIPGVDYEFLLNVHDEFQIEVRDGWWGEVRSLAEEVAMVAEWSIMKAGEAFKFRCPLKGNADIGFTWADTH